MKTISRDELKAKMERSEEFFLVETLAESCYQHSHLPGAIHLSPLAAQQDAPAILPDKSALIVLYCSDITCLASGDVAEKLQAMGYSNVRVYEDGKQDWLEAGLPVEGRSRMNTASKK
jgi:rhodanese-related sulfurtransferase